MTDSAHFAWTADDALARADGVLETLRRAGVLLPAGNRIALAKKTIFAARDPDSRIDVADPYVEYVVEAHRTILEAYAICAGMDAHRPAPVEKLSALLKGSEIPSADTNSLARDTQFELLVAAVLRLAAFESVSMSEPDICIDGAAGPLGIAAKRLRSAKQRKWQQRVSEATRQLRQQNLHGFLAFSLDQVIAPEAMNAHADNAAEDPGAANAKLLAAVSRLADMVPPAAAGPQVLALLGFGTRFDWVLADNGVSMICVRFLFNLHWIAPNEVRRPVEQFSRELGRRVTKGIERLLSPQG